MDQAASLRSQPRHALLLNSSNGTVTQVPFDLQAAGLVLLVIDTRTRHALADGQYGTRRKTCRDAATRLGITELREVADLESALGVLPDLIEQMRVRHVVTEIARTAAFVDLVTRDRLRDVGAIMDASHESLRTDYEVSCVELDLAVAAARAAGALGARMTGGGFGGSVIALVEADSASHVAGAVARAFSDRGLRQPAFLNAVPGAPADRVEKHLAADPSRGV